MKRHKGRQSKSLTYKKERVVLSEILPYELPLTFSNRHFYKFLTDNAIEYEHLADTIRWNSGDGVLDEIVRLLFGVERSTQIVDVGTKEVPKKQFQKLDKSDKHFWWSIPFKYRISHKDNDFRELTICHPRNQLQMVHFYSTYKELILYYCSVSPFSIRFPCKISRFVFHKDKAHFLATSEEGVGVEEIDYEYENLRSFFVYDKYSYIYKFYESDLFHRCEKKYNKLRKLDVSKCFDSIYTHTLSWALLNKEAVKEHIGENKHTFSGKFDELMCELNYGETNGIVIGPEFSRIFAELILQSVDKRVCAHLARGAGALYHSNHFEMFRYVDDYFIFYNDDKDADKVVRALQSELKLYGLHLNSEKADQFEKPIITGISMAKHRIASLFDDTIGYTIETEVVGEEVNGKTVANTKKKGKIYLRSGSLITQFKTIIKECNVSYKDMLTYSLAILERKSKQILKDFERIEKDDSTEPNLIKAVHGLLEFTFFIYSVSPRVNTTIRLSRVLQVFLEFVKRRRRSADSKHSIFKLIYDNIHFILEKNVKHPYMKGESMFLLVVLGELGRGYWLEDSLLSAYAECDQVEEPLSYLSIMMLMFYMKNKKKYQVVREKIEGIIKDKFNHKLATLRKEAELTLLFLDCIACPYIADGTKRALFEIYGITDLRVQSDIVNRRKAWFTTWSGFEFGRELDAKRSLEVY